MRTILKMMGTVDRSKMFAFLIFTMCLTLSQEQTDCADNYALCRTLADQGLCRSHRDIMNENCPQSCGICRNNVPVIFPKPSIANPEFVCGIFADVSLSREKRQLGNVLNGILGGVGAARPNSSSNNNQPVIPNFNSILPNFNPVRPIINPSRLLPNPFQPGNNPFIPSTQIVRPNSFTIGPSFNPFDQNNNPFIPSFNFQTSRGNGNPTKEIFTTVTSFATATAVGGGSDASTPSVGIVFVVGITTTNVLSRPTGRPVPTPITPRPTPISGTVGVTRLPPLPRPVPNPSPVTRQPLNPQPVSARPKPTETTSAVITIPSGEETLSDAICGSVPITDRFILSAAHCFPDPNKRHRVRLGDLDISQTGESKSQPQNVDIEKIYIHPSYRHSLGVRYNDIALLKTQQKIQFSSLVAPFCVLPRPRDFSGAPLTVAGFGFINETHRSPVLQSAVLEGLNDVRCEERYRREDAEILLRRPYPDLLVGKGILCASAFRRSACQGDSGGPLTIQDNIGRNYILGVVSIGGSCLSNLPGLYTDVAHHINWIDHVIYGS